jgi:hypothetical protein
MGKARLGPARLRSFAAVLVLFALAGCSQPRRAGAPDPSPTPAPTPAVATGTCADGAPTARCAEKLASDLGFAVLWTPVPAGWQVRQGLIAHPGTRLTSLDIAQGGLDVGMVSGDTSGVPPGMRAAGTMLWQGSRVTLWRGVPDPSSFPSGFPAPAWVVTARWTYQGQSYNVGILANPELGPTGTPQDGMRLLQRILHHGARYAHP